MPRVDLRDVEAADEARIAAWRRSQDVDVDPADERGRCWIVELDEEPAGIAALYDIDQHNRRCAWAFHPADASDRALDAYVEYWLLEYVFEGLKFEKLWCEVLASNEALWRLHESFGFIVEARFRGHVATSESRADVLGLGLLAADWRERRQAMAGRLRATGYDPPALM